MTNTKAERTRQFIIEKAAPLFNSKGYFGTSMDDILQATGLAKGGVYGNFKNKEEIAIAAFEHAFEIIIHELTVRIKSQTTYLDKLKAIVDYYYNYPQTCSVAGGCPLLNTSCDVDDTLPAIKARVMKALDQMLGSLVYLIETGKTKGEFKSSVKAHETADIIFSQIEGGIMLAKMYGNPSKLNRVLDHLKVYIDKELKA